MRRVIDRKIYDTETAEEIADVSAPCNDSGDFAYEETHLYRTKNGRWFIAGNGGGSTATVCGAAAKGYSRSTFMRWSICWSGAASLR
jgi:hypothetical protein